jgi:hypothetical protein
MRSGAAFPGWRVLKKEVALEHKEEDAHCEGSS